MKYRLSAAVMLSMLFAQEATARHLLDPKEREAFRKAVEQYQMFVVPHCAPEEVRAYVAARADRDMSFVRSLRKTELEADYKQAVADRAAKDLGTVYECLWPPPPPPPPGTPLSEIIPMQAAPRHPDTTAEHFSAGDQQFETMAQIRNALIGSKDK